MTKRRPPLSVNAALDRIALQVDGGWTAMAPAIGKRERTVRNYSDPDTAEEISVRDAIALDILFQKHGGEGAPILETFALQLEVERAEVFATQAEIARRAQNRSRKIPKPRRRRLPASHPARRGPISN